MAFVHLHVHSVYSLLDGASRLEDLAKTAAAMGQTALAITDHGVMYGAVDFYKACRAEGIKPIIGCEVYVAPRSLHDKVHGVDNLYSHLILLCRNEEGYHNLCRLEAVAFTEGFYVKPRIDWDLLAEHHEGLICLSGCLAGALPTLIRQGDYAGAKAKALELAQVFGEGNFYLEIQDHGLEGERESAAGLIRIARETGLPLAVTNDSHYTRKEDAQLQDILLCIQTKKTIDDPQRLRFESEEFYLKSEEEMRALYPEYPEACDNTCRIADACNFDFTFGQYHLPHYLLPEGESDAFAYLQKLCEKGFQERYLDQPEAHERLDYELSVIRQMGFVEYFLIVQDYVSFARRQKIFVGPGRGSAAGSVVSYCLHITDIDPIRYALYFERFLNPERVSMPDIDVDFEPSRRDEVMDYVVRRYGKQQVAKIVTFGTLKAKQAIRDVGRVMNVDLSRMDAVAKMVPSDAKMTIDTALQVSPQLREAYETDPTIKKVLDLAKGLEGLPRQASTHPAGVVITQDPVVNYVPLAVSEDAVVCQFQAPTLEELGLLKMDLLSVRNLTLLEQSQQMARRQQPDFNLRSVPFDDPEVYAMLCAGRTKGVFQMESSGMTRLCVQMKPKRIDDVFALIALFRPGPMDSIPAFLENSAHPEKIQYKTPLLEPILNVTYGCILYQEQVIDIFRQIAGYTMGQADNIRRAMSKKKDEKIEAERHSFIYGDPSRSIAGAVARGVPAETANAIFDDMKDFGRYAFNKAHAVSYAYVTYYTAYMKCHWPTQYMSALLSSELSNTAKLQEYIAECKDMGIEILPPDVNESGADFTAVGKNIRFGLAAIKGVGAEFTAAIERTRQEDGPFLSFDDFCRRLCHHGLNRKAADSLISAGAFDSMGYPRKGLRQICNQVVTSVTRESRENLDGQMDIFSLLSDPGAAASAVSIPVPRVTEFSKEEKMAMEKEATGLYFSGHPMDAYAEVLPRIGATPIASFFEEADPITGRTQFHDLDKVRAAGILSSLHLRTTRTHKQMANAVLEDNTGSIDLVIFSNALDRAHAVLKENAAVLISGSLVLQEDRKPEIRVDDAVDLRHAGLAKPEAPSAPAKDPTLYVQIPSETDPRLARIQLILNMFPGTQRMVVFCKAEKKKLGIHCLIHEALVQEMKEMFGSENVVVK